jgi:hypothetical protein
MTRTGVRLVLVLLLLGGLCGAGYVVWSGERALQSASGPASDFDARAGHALAVLADLRAGHQAYVASGQSLRWWQDRVAEGLADVTAALADLRQQSDDPGVLNDLEAASSSLDEFALADRRAANLVRGGEAAQASRVVFGEGATALASTAERITAARMARRLESDARRAVQRDLEAKLAAGCAGLSLLVALLLLPVRRTAAEAPGEMATAFNVPRAERTEVAAPRPEPVPPAVALREAPAAGAAPAATPGPAVTAAPADETAPVRDRRKSPELRAAADLCTDLARLRDSQELPSLLERSARLLDAVGLIVWIADPLGNELRPTFAHGYPPQALARLPAIARSADNATAAAFRHARVEVVKTNGMSPGAIAAPLLTPDGAIGVLAAEVRHGREASETTRAVARILAAQLSTLLSVPAAETQGRHALG